MRRGIREASSRQQAEIDTTDTSAEKGLFLEFIDMLKDILGYIEIIPGESRREDSKQASGNMPLFDDSVIGNAYRTVSDDEDEEDDEEDEAEDDGESSEGSNRQRRRRGNRRNASPLLRKINSLANRARTFPNEHETDIQPSLCYRRRNTENGARRHSIDHNDDTRIVLEQDIHIPEQLV
jgi:hypothetical protein